MASVPVGRRSPTPRDRRPNSSENEVIHMSLSGTLIRCLYYWYIPVLLLMAEFATWGLTCFRMGLSVMEATKLKDACFMYCFYQVLCWQGGGSCGGGPLSTLGGVTGYGKILWTTGGARKLGCIQAEYRWGDIIGTLGSGIITCGIGDV